MSIEDVFVEDPFGRACAVQEPEPVEALPEAPQPKPRKLANKHDLLAASKAKAKKEEVVLPVGDEDFVVFVRKLTAGEMVQLQSRLMKIVNKQPEKDIPSHNQLLLLVECVVDERDRPVFLNAGEVGELSYEILNPLVTKACELNPFTKVDLRLIGKNSEAAPDLTSIE